MKNLFPIDLSTVKVGDSLLFQDGQLHEVETIREEKDIDYSAGTFQVQRVIASFYRISFATCLWSGTGVADFCRDGRIYREDPKRVPDVWLVLRSGRRTA